MSEENVKKYIEDLPDNQPGAALDIGACIGQYTGLLAKKFEMVYAVEADLLNVSRLTENIRNIENVTIIPKAMAANDGHVKLFTAHHPGCHTIVEKEEHLKKWGFSLERYRVVPATTLNTIYKRYKNIKFIKCDIEGGEDYIFYEAKELLTSTKLTVILETHVSIDHKKLYTFYKDMGYSIYSLDKMEPVDNFLHEQHYLLRN